MENIQMFEKLPQEGEGQSSLIPLHAVIRRAAKRKGLSPANIQKITGVPWSTLQGWLNDDVGRIVITPNFKKVCVLLELTIEELLETVE